MSALGEGEILNNPDATHLLSMSYQINQGDLKDFFDAFVELQKQQPEFIDDLKEKFKSFQKEIKTKQGLDRTLHKIAFILSLLVIVLSSLRSKEKKRFFDSLIQNRNTIKEIFDQAKDLKEKFTPVLERLKSIGEEIKQSPVSGLQQLGECYVDYRKEGLALTLLIVNLIKTTPEPLLELLVKESDSDILKAYGNQGLAMLKHFDSDQCCTFADLFLKNCITLAPESTIADFIPMLLNTMTLTLLKPTAAQEELSRLTRSETFFAAETESLINTSNPLIEKAALEPAPILSSIPIHRGHLNLSKTSAVDKKDLNEQREHFQKKVLQDFKSPILDYFFNNPKAFREIREPFYQLPSDDKIVLLIQLQNVYRSFQSKDSVGLVMALTNIPEAFRKGVIEMIPSVSQSIIDRHQELLTTAEPLKNHSTLEERWPLIADDQSATLALLDHLAKLPSDQINVMLKTALEIMKDDIPEFTAETYKKTSEALYPLWFSDKKDDPGLSSFLLQTLGLIRDPKSKPDGIGDPVIPVEMVSSNLLIQKELIFLQKKLSENDLLLAIAAANEMAQEHPDKSIMYLKALPFDIRMSVLKITLENFKSQEEQDKEKKPFYVFLSQLNNEDLSIFTMLLDRMPLIKREDDESISSYMKHLLSDSISLLSDAEYDIVRDFFIKQTEPLCGMLSESLKYEPRDSTSITPAPFDRQKLGQDLSQILKELLKGEHAIRQGDLARLIAQPSLSSFLEALDFSSQIKKSSELIEKIAHLVENHAETGIDIAASKLCDLPLIEDWHVKSKTLQIYYDDTSGSVSKEMLYSKIYSELKLWTTYLDKKDLEMIAKGLSDPKNQSEHILAITSFLQKIPNYEKSTIASLLVYSQAYAEVMGDMRNRSVLKAGVFAANMTTSAYSIFHKAFSSAETPKDASQKNGL